MKSFSTIITFFILVNVLFYLLYPILIPIQAQSLIVPQTIEESKGLGWQIIKNFPQILQNGFKEIFGLLKRWWNIFFSYLKSIWSKSNVKKPFLKEIERRKSVIEKEISDEKFFKSVSEKKSFWRRLNDLIK